MNPKLLDCRDAWHQMVEAASHGSVRNYTQLLDLTDYVVETDLFPRDVLEAYSALNKGQSISNAQRALINPERGGPQGDYSEGMPEKIANVIDCLTRFPQSKRASITICNHAVVSHESDADAKCVRDIQLYLDEDGRLSGTVYLRAQAASLFPKNLHMVGSIMHDVADALPGKPALGTLFYLAAILEAQR